MIKIIIIYRYFFQRLIMRTNFFIFNLSTSVVMKEQQALYMVMWVHFRSVKNMYFNDEDLQVYIYQIHLEIEISCLFQILMNKEILLPKYLKSFVVVVVVFNMEPDFLSGLLRLRSYLKNLFILFLYNYYRYYY